MGIAGQAQVLKTTSTPIRCLNDIFTILKQTYGLDQPITEVLENIQQEDDETVKNFLTRLKTLLILSGAAPESPIYKECLFTSFKSGLKKQIREVLKRLYPKDLSMAYDWAITIEKDIKSQTSLKKEKPELLFNIEDNEKSKNQSLLAITPNQFKANKTNHYNYNNYKYIDSTTRGNNHNFQMNNKRSVRISCFHCNKVGHSFRSCRLASDNDKEYISKNIKQYLEKDLNLKRGNMTNSHIPRK